MEAAIPEHLPGPPHPLINNIRREVEAWRDGGYTHTPRAVRDLLEYWGADQGVRPRPFFCQREAIETLIWLLDAGPKADSPAYQEIRKELDAANARWNEGIPRLAVKMATGAGKTMVMKMFMLWRSVATAKRCDFLIIAPGLTIKDRLQELSPQDDRNRKLYQGLLPPGRKYEAALSRIHLDVINFQAFQRRSDHAVAGPDDLPGSAEKRLLSGQERKESEAQMLDRLLKSHRGRGDIFVINDEAHHAYNPQPENAEYAEAANAETKAEEKIAALWFSALRALQRQGRLAGVIDLSATPIYPRRPIGLESEIFPWVVSDYPLIEAIEAGITKIPRVPVEDDTPDEDPAYLKLFEKVKVKNLKRAPMPHLVSELLRLIQGDYNEVVGVYQGKNAVHPVFIIVANNIRSASALYEHIAGYKTQTGKWVEGKIPEFSNIKGGAPLPPEQAPTLLIHSDLDNEQAQKKPLEEQAEIHCPDLAIGKQQLKRIREIFNTVGKEGPGKNIRCVVSVQMLNEGWDTRSVTHIMGYRAFKSPLLCEQVAGRALRRTSFDNPGEGGRLDPEYASIFGVPFHFMRGGDLRTIKPPHRPYLVEALPERSGFRIEFPNLVGTCLAAPPPHFELDPAKVEAWRLPDSEIPGTTRVAPVVGEDIRIKRVTSRDQRILYEITAQVMKQFRESRAGSAPDNNDALLSGRRALFLGMYKATYKATMEWLTHPNVEYTRLADFKKGSFIETAARQIAQAVVQRQDGAGPKTLPIFDELEPLQSSKIEPFETCLRFVHTTVKSELNRAACHSFGEREVAKTLDAIPSITRWVRNFHLGWTIPYWDPQTGAWRSYEPDFIAEHESGVRLLIEYKGRPDDKAGLKTEGAGQWIAAVEGSKEPGCGDRWTYVFIEEADARSGARTIEASILSAVRARAAQASRA